MYLKSLVLKGFKSFADRSVLALEPGMTAIVGPNGSGKSNISDAVLWVLGERNARNLRGQAMEDVIFAGSSARRATGLAEVDLVLDNSDGTLPVDFSEVVITRRMFRSGESEYLINGTVARRMDVLDILHDSGLGTGTHSIISQGSLDAILQSKPEDRRALIEEAAGVLKHKQRKEKSRRKLESMDHHLERARDVAAEVGRQLAPLERKAQKARRYKELTQTLADADLKLAVDDLRNLQRQWNDAVAREKELGEALEAKRLLISQVEEELTDLQEQVRVENVDAGQLASSYRRASAVLERIDSAIMIMRDRQRSAQSRSSELELALETNASRKRSAEEALVLAEATLAEVRTSRAQADEEVQKLDKTHRELIEQRRALEEQARSHRNDEAASRRALEELQRKLSEARETLASGTAHIKVIEGHLEDLSSQLKRAQADADEATADVQKAEAEVAELETREAEVRSHVADCLKARDESREEADEARQKEQAAASEIRGLEEVERAIDSEAGPARAWLLDHSEELEGALAPLSHAVKAAQGYEALVERLLGDDMAALLVDDGDSIRRLAAALDASDSRGDAALVMRSDKAAVDPKELSYPSERGRSTLLSELTYPEEDARAIGALLGDVVICKTLDDALRAHAEDELGLRFVTPDGCVVWPNGKVIIGRESFREGEGVLARVRRLEALRSDLEELTAESAAAAERASQAEEALHQAQAESLDLSQQLALSRGTVESARRRAQAAEERLSSLRDDYQAVELRLSEAQDSLALTKPQVASYEEEEQAQKEALRKATEAVASFSSQIEPLQAEIAQAQEQLAAARLEAAKLAERDAYNARMCDSRRDELGRLADEAAAAQIARDAKLRSVQRLVPLVELFDGLESTARRWTESLEQQANDAQSSSTGLHTRIAEARDKARNAHREFDKINESLGDSRVEKGKLELQVENAVNVIIVDCKTPLETALEQPPLEDRNTWEEQATTLRRRIANLGTINPDAAMEYEELKARYDYLSGQLEDLEGARSSLQKITRVIDARMKDDFVQTYQQVDQNFQEIFALLFPGGSAHLSLDDPEDLENTGVEVSAQPRGKRITKMSLLSGGEKSLTALALLFAVYRTRSTPFYILDEVEAALDDTNLRRLIAYLDELRHTTQLILITHQRRTMETADVLFGVSMQADGVTKVISQKLEKALQSAEG